MILHALTQYYERKKSDFPPYGFEIKNIPVIIEIARNGELVQICKGDIDSAASDFIVPKSVKKTSDIRSNLLWENTEYALGMVIHGQTQRVAKQHRAFRERIFSLGQEAMADEGIQALWCFLENVKMDALKNRVNGEVLLTNPYLSFRLQGDTGLICQRETIRKAIIIQSQAGDKTSFCSVSGKMDQAERLHPFIRGVWGAQSSGANIVSFNLDAFNSYAKTQGFNAPIGKQVSFAYTTALNHLLRKGSEQRVQIGDASVVFWSKKETSFENDFSIVWGTSVKEMNDNPDKYIEAVKAICNAASRGEYALGDDDNTEFYILGLSPNASRISIRFWITGKIRQFSRCIKQHFDDLATIHDDRDIEALPLYLLLVNSAVQGKADNISPNLAGEVMQSILTGTPYPFTLFAAVVRRCKSEQKVNYPRAAMIKAYLNRLNKSEELTMALDKSNLNAAYRSGRLFAILEKIQEEAYKDKINSTIRDRYYSMASSNPRMTFPTLLKLNNNHLHKLENWGRKINFKKLLGEVIAEMPPEFPGALSIKDQGRFAVGYYHQRQDFFIKKTTNEPGESL